MVLFSHDWPKYASRREQSSTYIFLGLSIQREDFLWPHRFDLKAMLPLQSCHPCSHVLSIDGSGPFSLCPLGFFGNVVFTNGIVAENDQLTIYCGASDQYVCSALFSLKEILASLKDPRCEVHTDVFDILNSKTLPRSMILFIVQMV